MAGTVTQRNLNGWDKPFLHFEETIDTNDGAVFTESVDLELYPEFQIQAIAASGAHTTHVVTVQVSADDTNWVNYAGPVTLTGAGVISAVLKTALRYVRLDVTTAEGAASTTKYVIQAKTA